MKRNISFKIILFLVISVLVVIAAVRGNRLARELRENVQAGDFRLSEFEWSGGWTEEPAKRQIGPVSSAKEAVEKGRELIMATLADTSMDGYFGYPKDPTDGRPLKVFYDAQSDCWLVYAALPLGYLGVAPFAVMQGDGTVLHVGYC